MKTTPITLLIIGGILIICISIFVFSNRYSVSEVQILENRECLFRVDNFTGKSCSLTNDGYGNCTDEFGGLCDNYAFKNLKEKQDYEYSLLSTIEERREYRRKNKRIR